jgi:hypothetical protein
MSEVYIGFANKEDMFEQFSISPEYNDIEVLMAVYHYEDYNGEAMVIFKKDGKLYEVNSSHCSCNGLEGSWLAEETNYEALLVRPDDRRYAPLTALRKMIRDEEPPAMFLTHEHPLIRDFGKGLMT